MSSVRECRPSLSMIFARCVSTVLGGNSQLGSNVGPIVLQSWENGSQSRPIEPGLHSRNQGQIGSDEGHGRGESVANVRQNQTGGSLRNCLYVVLGIAPKQPTLHKVVSVPGLQGGGERSEQLPALLCLRLPG